MDREEYEKDMLCGHRSSDGRHMVKVSGFGKYTAADAVDLAAGKPYVRKRDRASDALPTVQTLFGPDVDLPDGLRLTWDR